ncbi:MAG: sugar-transfer associated ATP-grasp domain-containing protein [Galbitalea sp.]
MVRIAGKISTEYKTPRVVILADMVANSVGQQRGLLRLPRVDFNLMNWRERKTFLTRPQANQLTLRLNDAAFKNLFSDKVQFNRKFAKYLGREWLDVRESTTEQLRDFVTKHGSVKLKDPVNLGGYGLEKKDATSIEDYEAFRQHLLETGQVLVEEFITQHPDLARLSPKSVNTLRIITYFDGTTPCTFSPTPSRWAPAPTSTTSGRAASRRPSMRAASAATAPSNKEGDKYLRHPLTDVEIVGFVVPLYDEAVAMAVEMAKIVPEVAVRRLGHRDHAGAPDRDRGQLQHGRLPDEAEPQRHQDGAPPHLCGGDRLQVGLTQHRDPGEAVAPRGARRRRGGPRSNGCQRRASRNSPSLASYAASASRSCASAGSESGSSRASRPRVKCGFTTRSGPSSEVPMKLPRRTPSTAVVGLRPIPRSATRKPGRDSVAETPGTTDSIENCDL